MSIGWNLNFTITERILECWLVESYGLWNNRPWKWRNMSRSAGCFVRRELRINVIVKTKSTTIFSMFYTLIDHRNDATKCSKLCSETTHQRPVVPLEFWTFYVVISMVHKSVDIENCGLLVKGTVWFLRQHHLFCNGKARHTN